MPYALCDESGGAALGGSGGLGAGVGFGRDTWLEGMKREG